MIGVNNAITVDVKMDALGRVTSRKTVIADTKTACSVRVVPMPDKLYDALEKWKENRYLDGKMSGKNFITNDSLVFGDEQGNVRTYRATDNNFKRFLKPNLTLISRLGLNRFLMNVSKSCRSMVTLASH